MLKQLLTSLPPLRAGTADTDSPMKRARTRIESIWIGVSPGFIDQPILKSLAKGNKPIHFLPTGGPTRQETVRNTLAEQLKSGISSDDWILVHDAARPGLSNILLSQLINSLENDAVGGLLALPLADTLKRADSEQCVAATLPRTDLWQAQTPQMFRYGTLKTALTNFKGAATDEAEAIEAMGLKPKLVNGELRNLKVTYPQDLAVLSALLNSKP